MIKRCTNKQGVVTFNISFQGLRPNKSLSQEDRENGSSHYNDYGCSSPKSLPMTPVILNRPRPMRYTSGSIGSDVDGADIEDAPQSAGFNGRLFQNFGINDENNFKAASDDFMTQDPIDFDELQKFIKQDKDDEDKSSVSTLSKSSKKIAKGKVGYVYKESRFKEEAKNKGKRQPWQPYEDEKVLELVAIHGQSWALIASMMGGRTGKQIRDRYLNNLRPDIKNVEWTRKEDQHLIALYRQIGRKWSKIATLMQGRTEGQVKNRFYSYIQKKILPFERSEEVGTSPDGENSPCSKANEEVHSYRKSYHSQMNNQEDPDNLRYSHVTSNADQPTCVDELDFPEEMNIGDIPLDCFGFEQNLAESYFPAEIPDPTDLISYQGGQVKNLISLSPEKFFGRNNFFPDAAEEFNGIQDTIHDPYPDNMSFTELAQEFKLHCQTTGNEREVEDNNNVHAEFSGRNCMSPNQSNQPMVYEFGGIGMRPLSSSNTILRQAIHNSAQRK